MKTYSVVIVGPSGSGKTVFLASMYYRLKIQGDLRFFLRLEEEMQRQRLTNLFAEVTAGDEWSVGTGGETSEWNFTCCVQTPQGRVYDACQFDYVDYRGGKLTDEEADPDLQERLENADVLLGILDGDKIRAYLNQEKEGIVWVVKEFSRILEVMQDNKNETIPIHFMISKWDLLKAKGLDFQTVHDALLNIDHFRNFVRNRAELSTLRLIPVSGVGEDFVTLQEDGALVRKPGCLPKPFQVEIPLACVLPDRVRDEIQNIQAEIQDLKARPTEVKPALNFSNQVNAYISKQMRELLPEKLRFSDWVLKRLIQPLEAGIQLKQKQALEQAEALNKERDDMLRKVQDEETAMELVLQTFVDILDQLDQRFPANKLNADFQANRPLVAGVTAEG